MEGCLGWKWIAGLFFLKEEFLRSLSISCRDPKPQNRVYVTGGEEMFNDCNRPQNMPVLHPFFLVSLPASLPRKDT